MPIMNWLTASVRILTMGPVTPSRPAPQHSGGPRVAGPRPTAPVGDLQKRIEAPTPEARSVRRVDEGDRSSPDTMLHTTVRPWLRAELRIPMVTYGVVSLDEDLANLSICRFEANGHCAIDPTQKKWSPKRLLTHPQGDALLDSVVARVQQFLDSTGTGIDALVLCVPGTIRDDEVIARSTRLGITTETKVADVLTSRLHVPVTVCRDVDCLALGEIYGSGDPAFANVEWCAESLAYVLVNEGIGMSLMFDGIVYHGAGSAGALGRMIVEPHGGFNATFASRGSLENYASRPGISSNIVAEYMAELDRSGGTLQASPAVVRQIEAAIASNQPRSLDVTAIASCADDDDELLRKVFRESATYMGMALSGIIATLNPPLIVLGGTLIESSKAYADLIQAYTRMFAYGAAWRRTSMLVATCGDKSHILGSALWAERRFGNLGQTWTPGKGLLL